MSAMLLPLFIGLLLALVVLGAIIHRRYPVMTWKQRVQELRSEESSLAGEQIRVVPQDANLSDLLTRDTTPVYTGTDSFASLVGVVEKVIDETEEKKRALRTKARTR